MPRTKARSSRRAPPLKEDDYDHVISLVDNAADDGAAGGAGADAESAVPGVSVADDAAVDAGDGTAEDSPGPSRRLSAPGPGLSPSPGPGPGPALSPVATVTSATPLLDTAAPDHPGASGRSQSPSRGRSASQYGSISKAAAASPGGTALAVAEAPPTGNGPNSSSGKGKQPMLSAELMQVPTAEPSGRPSLQSVRPEPEAAIDILYENERGIFLCGIPLFSHQALGNLDPSPWTNFAHGTSPTSTLTAQVPDPSWEWAWPEWRINQTETGDADGWEYSFMFATCFSWHGPTWYSSFVRRRAWMRKRVRRKTSAALSAAASAVGLGEIDSVTDPHLLNPDYFTVVSAASMRRSSSRGSSRLGSRLSLAAPSAASAPAGAGGEGDANGDDNDDDDDDDARFEMPKEITDADTLMRFLRAARIDREKIEAVDNFIQHAGEDLVRLQDVMHEVMALFVFQASRRTLLTHLTEAHEAAVQARQRAVADAAADEAAAAAARQNGSKDEPKPDGAEGANGAANGRAGAGAGEPEETTGETTDARDWAASPATGTAKRLQALGRRVGYLTAAVKHADEEVRRLEYWSDIRAVAERGVAQGGGKAAEEHVT